MHYQGYKLLKTLSVTCERNKLNRVKIYSRGVKERRMEWVANILHTTSEHGVFSIATADAHTSAASSRLN